MPPQQLRVERYRFRVGDQSRKRVAVGAVSDATRKLCLKQDSSRSTEWVQNCVARLRQQIVREKKERDVNKKFCRIWMDEVRKPVGGNNVWQEFSEVDAYRATALLVSTNKCSKHLICARLSISRCPFTLRCGQSRRFHEMLTGALRLHSNVSWPRALRSSGQCVDHV